MTAQPANTHCTAQPANTHCPVPAVPDTPPSPGSVTAPGAHAPSAHAPETLAAFDERDLLGRAAAGDDEALSKLLALYGPSVRASLTIDRKWAGMLDHDDVMQVTYLEAFLRIRDFQAVGPGAFPAWLRRIADHNLRDAVKGLQRQKRPPPARRVQALRDDSTVQLLDLLGVTSATPSRAAAAQELQVLLHNALAALPADYAAVVRLYDLEARPIAAVAAELARSPGAVHMLRSRAHVHLRALLGSQSRFFSGGA